MNWSAFIAVISYERPATIFVRFVPSVLGSSVAKAVYMVLGSSSLVARKNLVLGRSTTREKYNPLHVNYIQKTYGARMIRLQ